MPQVPIETESLPERPRIMELPTQFNVVDNPNVIPNIQFRYEAPGQQPAPNLQQPGSSSYESGHTDQWSWNQFSIPTKTEFLSSGFTYDQRLQDLRVSNEQWFQFCSEVVNSAKLTPKEDYAAWTAGITTGTICSPFLLVFAPLVGWHAGKSVHKKTVVKKVKERLLGDGEVRSVLRKWNEGIFRDRGLHTWIQFPGEVGNVQDDDLDSNGHPMSLQRFKIAIIPNEGIRPPMAPLMQQSSPEQQAANLSHQKYEYQHVVSELPNPAANRIPRKHTPQSMSAQISGPVNNPAELPNNPTIPPAAFELPSSPVLRTGLQAEP